MLLHNIPRVFLNKFNGLSRNCVTDITYIVFGNSVVATNGVARIFFGGGQFSVISGGRPDSVGEG